MISYFVKIAHRKYDGSETIFEASGISEEALEIILSNYFGINYDIKICKEAPSLDENSIESLDLSIRSFNCLKRAYIITIPQLVEACNTGKLLTVRNLGRRSCEEITKKLLRLI